jgi:hypothetical protein
VVLGGVAGGAVLTALLPQPWSWLAGVATVGGAATGYFWLWNAISKPLARMKEALQRVSEGDLMHEQETAGCHEFAEVLVGLQTMKVNMFAVISDVVTAANNVEQGCRQLVQQAAQLLAELRLLTCHAEGINRAEERAGIAGDGVLALLLGFLGIAREGGQLAIEPGRSERIVCRRRRERAGIGHDGARGLLQDVGRGLARELGKALDVLGKLVLGKAEHVTRRACAG